MEFDFDKIIRLKKVRMEKSVLSEKENLLSEPILEDRSMICGLYSIFKDALNEKGCPPRIDSVNQRKKFIFIVLYLYAPSVLAGGKMPKGLREEICKALNFHSVSTISDNCSDIVFLYQNYSNFSSDVKDIFDYIMNRVDIKAH